MKVTKGLLYYLDMWRVNMYCEKCAFNSGDNFVDWREDEKGRRYWMCPSCSRKNYPIDPPSFTPTKHLLENAESHQPHYDIPGRVQFIDIVVQYGLDYFEAGALKYLLRYKRKGGLKDLRKLEQHVHWLISRGLTQEHLSLETLTGVKGATLDEMENFHCRMCGWKGMLKSFKGAAGFQCPKCGRITYNAD